MSPSSRHAYLLVMHAAVVALRLIPALAALRHGERPTAVESEVQSWCCVVLRLRVARSSVRTMTAGEEKLASVQRSSCDCLGTVSVEWL